MSDHSSPTTGSCPSCPGDLDSHRELVRQLYVEQRVSLKEVIKLLRTKHNLTVSPNQCKKKFKIWNVKKTTLPPGVFRIQAPSKFKTPHGRSAASPLQVARSDTSHSLVKTAGKEVKSSRGNPRLPEPVMERYRYQIQQGSLRSPTSPMVLRLQEESFHVILTHVSRLIEPRLLQEPGDGSIQPQYAKSISQRRRLPPPPSHHAFLASIMDALTPRPDQAPATMMALLEKACRQIKPMLESDHFFTMGMIVEAACATIINGNAWAGSLILRQLWGMAEILLSEHHPYTILAKNLYYLIGSTPGIIEQCMKSCVDAITGVLGPDDPYVWLAQAEGFTLQLKLQGSSYTSQDLLKQWQIFLERVSSTPNSLRFYISLTCSYVGQLNSIKEFKIAEAASAVAPDYFVSCQREVPEFNGLDENVMSMMLLHAQALAGQKKYEIAQQHLTNVINWSAQEKGRDKEMTIRAIITLGNILAEQDLHDDAKAVFKQVDERLSPYMLGNGRSEDNVQST